MAKFKPPTREEANNYARSIGYKSFDYDVWYAYYEARGWKPKGSTTQMSSWRAAIRTWYYRTDEYKMKKRQPKPRPEPVPPKINPATPEQKAEIKQRFNKTVKGLGIKYRTGESPQEKKVRTLKTLEGKII